MIKNTTRLLGRRQIDGAAINREPIMSIDTISKTGVLAIDSHSSRLNPSFYLSARTETGAGEDFLYFLPSNSSG
jgi:hypothetical protein